MYKAGMNIARVNGAYADISELDRVAKDIRSISKDIALVLDIKGTEVRLNKFKGAIKIKPGEEIVIGTTKKDKLYPETYPNLYKDLKKGDVIFIDDGKVKLKIAKVGYQGISCKVLEGKEILPGKTINTPTSQLNNPPITKRDVEQIKFVIKDDWDFVAASFVRRVDDINQVKKFTKNSGIKILAKVENDEGVENINEIITACDGIIVARGDLGVEIPYKKVPMIQKEIITKCLLQAKPAIVATHMLESMRENTTPTRAEISDIANAVLDGSDCVWLSAETSTGKYPVKSVTALSNISQEADGHLEPIILATKAPYIKDTTIAIAKAAIEICESLPIDKIIVDTGSGKTARVVSSYKPKQPIIAITNNDICRRQLQLTWGVQAVTGVMRFKDRDTGIRRVAAKALDSKLVKPNDFVVIIRGTTPYAGMTNSLEVGVAKELAKHL